LGVWKIDNSRVDQVVVWAFKSGYRHIDTACAYRNETGVGQGIRQSGLSRQQVFITTKLAVQDFFKPETAFLESLNKLKTDYVDLYLLHWPFFNWKNAWKTLEEFYQSGRAKAIGVSNFGINQLQELKKLGGIKPLVNQVELSPFLFREKLIDYCQSEDIAVEAYSPLTRGKRINDPLLTEMSKSLQITPAQIMIRWGLQHNLIMLPKSETKSHIQSNFDVFDFEIDKKDMQKLDQLNENYSALIPGWSRKD
jgi:methylglyoxal/glyoxal reductase